MVVRAQGGEGEDCVPSGWDAAHPSLLKHERFNANLNKRFMEGHRPPSSIRI
jgi:hypothetical protein